MDTESNPVPLKRSWTARHPLVVIGVILVVCLGPFVNKALQTDDPLFVWSAQQIQKHPTDFFGFEVSWAGPMLPMWLANCNPPLASYLLALAATLFGWSEAVLHGAFLAMAFAAGAGIYQLARLWCERALLATVLALLTPVFLVSSTTLMCDVPMLAIWIWAVVLWERALQREQAWWRFIAAGGLMGLAVLTKYSAITLLPLLPLLAVLRTRKAGGWLLGLAVPLVMLGGYEFITARMYGKGLFSLAVDYARMNRHGFIGGGMAKAMIGLAFSGGCLLPTLFFAPLLWRRKPLWAGGLIVYGVLLAAFRLFPFGNPEPELMQRWSYLLQVVLLTVAGFHLLVLAGVEAWQRRDRVSVALALWIISGFLFATVLNWTISARSLLPIVPAAAILVVRRLERCGQTLGLKVGGRLVWPLIASAVVGLSLVHADYESANLVRGAVQQLVAKYKTANKRLWFEGHGGFQYYMEKLGCQPIDPARSLLQPGDILVVNWRNNALRVLAPGSVGPVERLGRRPSSWMNLAGTTKEGSAGFYSADWGPIPFMVGRASLQVYHVLRVYSHMQFRLRSALQPELQARDMRTATPMASS